MLRNHTPSHQQVAELLAWSSSPAIFPSHKSLLSIDRIHPIVIPATSTRWHPSTYYQRSTPTTLRTNLVQTQKNSPTDRKTLRNNSEIHSANDHILPKNHGLGGFCGTFVFLGIVPLHPSSSLMAYLWRHHPPLVSSTFKVYGPATAAVASEPWQLGGSAK